LTDLGQGGVQLVLAAREYRDPRALGGELLGGRQTDAAVAACERGNLAFELFIHIRCLEFWPRLPFRTDDLDIKRRSIPLGATRPWVRPTEFAD
jgi:hypothetical protein